MKVKGRWGSENYDYGRLRVGKSLWGVGVADLSALGVFTVGREALVYRRESKGLEQRMDT